MCMLHSLNVIYQHTFIHHGPLSLLQTGFCKIIVIDYQADTPLFCSHGICSQNLQRRTSHKGEVRISTDRTSEPIEGHFTTYFVSAGSKRQTFRVLFILTTPYQSITCHCWTDRGATI